MGMNSAPEYCVFTYPLGSSIEYTATSYLRDTTRIKGPETEDM